MLFRLSLNTPKFEVFRLLNAELLHFLEHSLNKNDFDRGLFTQGDIGQSCWDNARENDARATKDLTRDKFEKLFIALNQSGEAIKRQLFEAMRDQQNMRDFFTAPNRDLLLFLPQPCFVALKKVATHLYCATKDLGPIIAASGGSDIMSHFNAFRAHAVNGNVCKACGMEKLAVFRAGVVDGDQWRADYDHQLCKSKYPIFAVHPDNLIPLCDVCNQDAKKAKDLFRDSDGHERLTFYPFNEEAKELISIQFENLRDPEPTIKVRWATRDDELLNKLDTWDEVYEIRNRVEGQFRSLEAIIEDEISPMDQAHLEMRIRDEARPKSIDTLKRKEWAFWYQKLFSVLEQIDMSPFIAKWDFVQQQASDGGDYIMND
ncbi:hypothetical protein BZJ19_02400 [Salinivibrio proteolyticus]|uniref:hypothetical protein n=1 Tax=Salinivibrio proteolyticus TaxID=334715 RepID=UPI000988D21C|nr:hypothetical protein [Salinivibrio proteolyticus]OOF27108.1 hypothetical protein BZJ19_02400 [Salinivibrio proteolyticus]